MRGASRPTKIRIHPFPLITWPDMRQRFRAYFDDDAFSALDLLKCAQNLGIFLQCGEHRLFDGEFGRASFRPTEIPLG